VDADVVVIGAGALGLSTALHCALAGRSVVVAERDAAGSQASGRAAGLFKSVQADELTDLLGSLHREGTTLVVITHNPVVAGRAQRQIAIRDGQLTEHPPARGTRAFPGS
jgi:glycine/D-amino acid oxidase-like deaminating enzyme